MSKNLLHMKKKEVNMSRFNRTETKAIRIAQLNLQNSRTGTAEIMETMSRRNSDVVLF